MLRLLKQMKAKQWIMALLCVALILGQIYFDLRLPDYMSDLTVQIKTPGSTVSDVLHTGLITPFPKDSISDVCKYISHLLI